MKQLKFTSRTKRKLDKLCRVTYYSYKANNERLDEMAKPTTLKQARKLLKNAKCTKARTGSHEIWKREDGRVFSLPAAKPKVSAGCVRQLHHFINGSENYINR